MLYSIFFILYWSYLNICVVVSDSKQSVLTNICEGGQGSQKGNKIKGPQRKENSVKKDGMNWECGNLR